MDNENKIVTLWLGAFRYYLGRRTYAVGDFCDLVIQEWMGFPEKLKEIMAEEIKEARERTGLGDECDRKYWEIVERTLKPMGEMK